MGNVVPAEPGWYAVGWAEDDDGLAASASRVVAWLIEGVISVRPVTFDGAPLRRHPTVMFKPDWKCESLAAGDFMFEDGFSSYEPSDDQVELLAEARALARLDNEKRKKRGA